MTMYQPLKGCLEMQNSNSYEKVVLFSGEVLKALIANGKHGKGQHGAYYCDDDLSKAMPTSLQIIHRIAIKRYVETIMNEAKDYLGRKVIVSLYCLDTGNTLMTNEIYLPPLNKGGLSIRDARAAFIEERAQDSWAAREATLKLLNLGGDDDDSEVATAEVVPQPQPQPQTRTASLNTETITKDDMLRFRLLGNYINTPLTPEVVKTIAEANNVNPNQGGQALSGALLRLGKNIIIPDALKKSAS